MALENSINPMTARIEALKVAASLSAGVVRPDAAEIVTMAKTFAEFVLDTGNATQPKRAPRTTKPQAPG